MSVAIHFAVGIDTEREARIAFEIFLFFFFSFFHISRVRKKRDKTAGKKWHARFYTDGGENPRVHTVRRRDSPRVKFLGRRKVGQGSRNVESAVPLERAERTELEIPTPIAAGLHGRRPALCRSPFAVATIHCSLCSCLPCFFFRPFLFVLVLLFRFRTHSSIELEQPVFFLYYFFFCYSRGYRALLYLLRLSELTHFTTDTNINTGKS